MTNRLIRHLGILLGAVLVLVELVVLWPTAPPAAATHRPNIVLITTDDMAATDLRWMPQTRRLLTDRGVKVSDFLSNQPMCCPARAEILTGQYGHNNGVQANNKAPWGGYKALSRRLDHVGAWLQKAGYRTALVGKYLNGWEARQTADRGWTIFNPTLRRIYSPYDQTMFGNGHPHRYPHVYTADLVSRLTSRYITRFSATRAPFFIWASQMVPHDMHVKGRWVNPVPAPRHRDLYPDARPPSLDDPAFNEADVGDKPSWVQARSPVTTRRVTALFRARIRALRAVDDQVRATVEALRRNGELADTYVFFTSDNGFMLGEHRLADRKNVAYDESLRVPLVVRGPGLPAGVTREATYAMIDLAPTFVAIAGATPGRLLDGRSMLATLRTGAPAADAYLIQAGDDFSPWWWRGVRTDDYVYVRYAGGFQELYDMRRDPAQLDNVAQQPAYEEVRERLAGLLSELEGCSGASCRR
ncbi:MAG TPA: sulfatase [Marmoricola sp.]|nr:sulfatase [Marmoricola sp.]